jgi:ketosteroid isomerase-like protein
MSSTLISTTDQDAIASANRRFAASFSSGSIAEAVGQTYTRDARVLPPGGDAIHGRDAIREFWPAAAAQLGISGLELETRELRRTGDGICEIGHGVISAAAGEQIVKYVVVWKQEDGDWRIDVDIWN